MIFCTIRNLGLASLRKSGYHGDSMMQRKKVARLYRIAYCDGSPMGDGQFLDCLEKVLEKLSRTCLISHFSDCGSLLAPLEQNPSACDLVFLDVPKGEEETGAAFVRRLRRFAPRLPVVLICSTFEPADYAIQSLHYLLRPVSGEQLREILLYVLQPPRPLLLRQSGSMQVVPLHQILYIEVFSHQLEIHTLAGQVLSVPGALTQIQQRVPAGQFLRCHKSYLVNLDSVEGIRRYQLQLSGGRCIPTSKKNYNEVRRSVFEYFASRAQSGESSAIQNIPYGSAL